MDIFHSSLNVDDSVSFTPEDIQALVQGLPKKKATGPDSISMEHLIYAPTRLFSTLASLYNGIIRCRHVPVSFTCSLIIPLFKGGGKDPSSPNSYRGISLSSNLSKVFERLVLNILQPRLLTLIHHL